MADRLHSLAIHLLRSLRNQDRESGVTGPRLSALSVIVFQGPLTLTALASAEQVRVPTMSRLIAALVNEGLVRRTPDAQDGRAALLEATPRGRRLLEEGRRRRVEALGVVLKHLAPPDRATLKHAVGILEGVVDTLR